MRGVKRWLLAAWRFLFGGPWCTVGSAYGIGGRCNRPVRYRQSGVGGWSYYCEAHAGWPMWDVTGTISPHSDYLEEHEKEARGEPNRFRELNRRELMKAGRYP